jgi:hypothetical protein
VRSKKQKKSPSTTPTAFLEPVLLDSPQQSTEETSMTAPIREVVEMKLVTPALESDETDRLRFFVRNEAFWWPFRAVSEALLQTQHSSAAYLEANRRLVDEARNIIRKEHDLLLELSETGRSEANKAFNRALTGIRELGEAWIDAQIRSLATMHAGLEARHGTAETHRELDAETV